MNMKFQSVVAAAVAVAAVTEFELKRRRKKNNTLLQKKHFKTRSRRILNWTHRRRHDEWCDLMYRRQHEKKDRLLLLLYVYIYIHARTHTHTWKHTRFHEPQPVSERVIWGKRFSYSGDDRSGQWRQQSTTTDCGCVRIDHFIWLLSPKLINMILLLFIRVYYAYIWSRLARMNDLSCRCEGI